MIDLKNCPMFDASHLRCQPTKFPPGDPDQAIRWLIERQAPYEWANDPTTWEQAWTTNPNAILPAGGSPHGQERP